MWARKTVGGFVNLATATRLVPEESYSVWRIDAGANNTLDASYDTEAEAEAAIEQIVRVLGVVELPS